MRPLPRAALLLCALVGLPAGAAAQPKRGFSTVRYRPAVGVGNYLGLEGAQTGPAGVRTYGVAFDYARDTLAVSHPCRAVGGGAVCDDRDRMLQTQTGLLHLLLGLGLGGHTQLSLDLPLGFADASEEPFSYTRAGRYHEVQLRDGFVLGDVRLQAKTRVYGRDRDPLRVAVALHATLPTGLLTSDRDCREPDACAFVGEHGVQAGGQGIVELAPVRGLRVGANVGVLYRPARALLGTEVGSELTFGVGAAYRVIPHLTAKAEIAGALELAGADDVPVEARVGLSYGRDLALTLGGGAGIVGDVGSPRYRLLAGLAWAPVARDGDGDGLLDGRDRCPQVPEDRDGFEDADGCPDLDNDRDGKLDALDGCDDAAEDRDGFEDDDGCPDPDNDQDGVLDGYDSCEGAQEDRDGDHDDDGCPDDDTDRDGVPDAADRCANEPEDTDGLGDEDGCPEADHDGDTLPDTEDACPEAPAGDDGVLGKQGCPL